MFNVGVILFGISLILLALGSIMLIISIWASTIRKLTRYTLLAGAVTLLVSFGLCSSAGASI